MKPQLEIRHSWIYNVLINKHYWKYSLKKHAKLKKDCRKFENLLNENKTKIIKLIEKHSKKGKWFYDFIPIYIVRIKPELENKRNSFSDPLTLKYKRDPNAMLCVLIHELIHNYLPEDGQVKRGREKNELLVWEITVKVWNDLGIPSKPKVKSEKFNRLWAVLQREVG
ncbi:MAG: hypothetical protein ABIH92_03895, partial [Nanoarchaeota archaeon]